jgi:hypothetical protein
MKSYQTDCDSSADFQIIQDSSANSKLSTYRTISLFFVTAAFLLIGLSFKVSLRELLATNFEGSDTPLTFTLYRDGYDALPYFTNVTFLTYAILNDYDAVIEPSVEMKIEFLSKKPTLDCHYEICSMDGTCQTGYRFANDTAVGVTFDCTPFDEFSVTVNLMSSDEIVSTQSGSALCLYVRREMYSLSSSDLAKAINSMYLLYSTSTVEGKLLYGESFENYSYFTNAHHFNAAWQDADHIHEGLGFFTQHIKLTNMFEEGVQVVDRSFALPYWDFTIEVAEGKSIFESIMFTNETFGSLPVPVEEDFAFTYANDSILDGRILDGLWQDFAAELQGSSIFGNSFGYMRAPWNLNPSPYLSRFPLKSIEMPSCEVYFYYLLTQNSMISWLQNAPYDIHGSLHTGIGGLFGCDLLIPMMEVGLINSMDDLKTLCAQWGTIIKLMYRGNFITPKTNCEVESFEKDLFQCGFDRVKSMSETVAGLSLIMKPYLDTSSYTTGDFEKWVDFIVDVESASASGTFDNQ